MKRDFPFWWAFFIAILLHTVLGFVLKRNPLLLAATPSAANAAPLQMHFVESPPNAKTLPSAPKTPYLSDANRKAGPLVASPRREMRTTEYAKGILPQGKSNASPTPPRRSTPGTPAATSQGSVPLPKIQQSPSENSSPADINIGSSQGDPKKLAQSLENLDQFIHSGNGPESGGSDSGDLPSGDPGSGVFFDTQGFDLGPWANRVVAIVRSNWIIPVAAELGVRGIVGVAFKVERSGKIVDIQIVRSSEIPSFDQAAANALKSSSPLPPLPPDFPRQVLPGVFRFYYNTPVPQPTTQTPSE